MATEHPLPLAVDQAAASIELRRVVLDIRRGTTIGAYVPGLTCFPPYDDITMAHGREALRDGEFAATFRAEMRRLGYDVIDPLDDLFDTAPDHPARLQFGARILSLGLNLCRQRDFFFYRELGVRGEAAIEVEWQVFDPEQRRIVFRRVTRGWAERSEPSRAGDELMVQDAFASALLNLAADPDLRALLIAAGRPTRIFGPAAAQPAAPRPGAPTTDAGPEQPHSPALPRPLVPPFPPLEAPAP